MIELILNNSYSQIKGLNIAQEKELKKLLSYQIDSNKAHFSYSYNTTRYLIDKYGNFPTGLVHIVTKWLPKGTKITDERKRKLFPYIQVNLKLPEGIIPYKKQTEAVIMTAGCTRGTVVMPTGTGKSFTMALLIDLLRLKTLIIVPTLGLKRQLTSTFKEYFGETPGIKIENIDSPTLDNETEYDCLIIDEAHHVAAKTYRKLNKKAWNKIRHRYFFTATPFRNRDEEQILMESIAGQVIYRLTYEEATKDKMIVPLEAYYVEVPEIKSDAYSWREVYNELVVNNKPRNAIIRKLIYNLLVADKSTLCLVKEIDHGVNISGHNTFAHGSNENTQELIAQFNSRQRSYLLGTEGVLGEGIDTRPAEYVIIAGGGKSKNAFMQKVGRALRNFPGKQSGKVILLKDTSHKFLLRHFQAQVKYLKEEYGIKPVKLELE